MIERGRYESRRLVAVDAITGGRHMVTGFSRGGIAVVTRRTVAHDALVIKCRTGKGLRRMARRTIFSGWNMVEIHASRVGTVVARRTVIHDSGVIKNGGRKCPAGNVADTAVLARCNVIGLGIHASRINTVVTGIAPAVDHFRARVVNKCVCKNGRIVANGAVPGRVLMYRRIGLASGAERYKRGAAIMARRAVPGYIQVAKNRRGECRCRVTIGTILVRGQMGCCLNEVWIGREKLTGMTTLATAHNARMRCLQECRRHETNR